MAASGILSVDSQKKCHSIKSALASAVLEWLLIFLLFVDGIFSYLITKFACYCELQTPCLLCSRLDRILGKYYWDLICGKHKSEISCLVLCHAHNKLVDVHRMCETCLFSFATINKSNAETYRLLVGKLGESSGFDMDEGLLLEEHTSRARLCSCCNSLWIPKGYRQNLLQMTIIGSRATYDQKVDEAGSLRSGHQKVTSQSHALSHIWYKELKVNSDSDSEVPLSDEGDDAAHFRSREISPTQNVGITHVQMEPRVVTQPNDFAVEKLIDALTELQPPVSVSQIQTDSSEAYSFRFTPAKVALGNGSEELPWQKADNKYDSSAFPELISLNDVPPSSIAKETLVEASTEIKHHSLEDGVPPSLDAHRTPAELSKESIHIAAEDIPPSSVKPAERTELISEDEVFVSEDANEKLVQESTESKHKLVDEVPSSSVSGEAIVEALQRSKLISVDDEIPWSDSKETLVQKLSPSRLISLVDVLPSPSGIETPVEGLKESYIPRPAEILQAAVVDSDENCKTITTADTITGTASETIPVSAENCQQVLNMLDLGEAYKLAVSSRGRQLSGVLAEQWTGKDSLRISDDLKLLFSQFSNTRDQSINDTSPRVSLSPKYSANSEELKNTEMQKIQSRISPERFALERNESGLSLDGSIVSEIEGETVVDRLTRQIEHDKKLLGVLYKELEEERNSSSIAVNQAMAMITRLQEEKATLQMEALQCVRMMEEQAEYDMEALQKTNDLLAAREKEIQDLEAELEYYRIKYPDEYLLEETMEPLFDMKTKEIKEENIESSSISTNTHTEKLDTSNKEGERNVSMGSVKSLLLDIEDERSYILKSLKDLEKKLSRFPDYQLSLANKEYSGEIGDIDPAQDHSPSVDIPESNEMFYTPMVPNLDILANEVYDLNERLKALEADRSFIEHSINSVRNGEDGLKFVEEIASHLRELRKAGIRREK